MIYHKEAQGLALFIDWENLKIGLQENYNTQPNIDALLAFSERYGQRGVSKAFADWQNYEALHSDQYQLITRSIDTVQILGRNPNSGRAIKNSADVALAIEATKLCYSNPEISSYVLISGDGDLIHLVNELKRNRNRVIVIALGNTMSRVLAEAADEVVLYEHSILPLINHKAQQQQQQVYGWIEDIVKHEEKQPVSLAKIGYALWQRHQFSVKNTQQSLRDYIDPLIEEGKLSLHYEGGVEHVILADEAFAVSIDEPVDGPIKDTKDTMSIGDDARHNEVSQKPNTSTALPKLKRNNEYEVIWRTLEDAYAHNIVLKATPSEARADGLIAKLGDGVISAFLPLNQLSLGRVNEEDLADYLGLELDVMVITLEQSRSSVILSHRMVLEQQQQQARAQLFQNTHIGDVIEAPISNITDFGLFVNLGPLDGLIHRHELPQHSKALNELYYVGQRISAEVIVLNPEEDKIQLSVKALNKRQWQQLKEHYPVNHCLQATVSAFKPYGVFVDFGEGAQRSSALLHISNLKQFYSIKHPKQLYNYNDVIDISIASFDDERQHFAIVLNPQKQLVPRLRELLEHTSIPRNLTSLLFELNYGNLSPLDHSMLKIAHKASWLTLLRDKKTAQLYVYIEKNLVR